MIHKKRMLYFSRNQKGMTLVELVVASSIMMLLMSAMSMVVARTYSVNKYVLEQGLNNTQLQNSLRTFGANFREARQSDAGGYPIELADDFEIIFYANIDSDAATEKVHYYLEQTTLKMGVSEAAGFPLQYPENDQQIKTIGYGITNTASQPIFYYYNEDYPEDQTNNPLATPAGVESISLIKIDIFANINPKHIPDNMRMETFIKPRNIE